MSRFLLIFILTLATGLLALSDSPAVSAQDCERVISGNAQSPCKIDYLDGRQAPRFVVERFTDAQRDYYCQPAFAFATTTPSTEDVLGDRGGYNSAVVKVSKSRDYLQADNSSRTHNLHERYSQANYFVSPNEIRIGWGDPLGLKDTVPVSPTWGDGYNANLADYYIQGRLYMNGDYWIESDVLPAPTEVNDYRLLMNQCLAGITRQLEHDAALETARQQVETDRVAAEVAAEEAGNQAELAAIELQSAQDALRSQETLNAALLAETILSIKREDTIRAAWQQVILVRMAGLEERTTLWNEAVERWVAEDLQFSTAMEARIQEIERLQALNAALEQSMADQRRLLIAQLEDLEKAERAAQDARNPATEPESGSQPGG